ncbi:MAG: DUF342 domain-containing protein [Lachnospiraceae bacterium]|nr:DUF342 domain-containing protein [Lachnospiraceae bacterium]
MRNGYIQVEIKGKMAVCHIFPPEDGGNSISFAEMEDYLKDNGLTNFDKKEFRNRLASGERQTMSLGLCDGLEFSEMMYTKISLDKLKVTCRFLPPSMGGQLLTVRDIMTELEMKKIIFGIDQDAIMDFMNNRQYATDYVFAKGRPPVIGKDAKIEYFFNTNPNLRPKYNEDGSVDYRDLNTICNVEEGDLLARLIPEEPGEPGMDVMGHEIMTRRVNSKNLRYGKNVRVSEDKTELYAETNGHVKLAGEQVYVSDVYEVQHDVDNSTGNIEFPGNVHIKGNVRGGFSVIARGDVIVDGVVEDALIQSGGQVIIKRGIHGMHKGIIDAEGNVITQFIENATIFSGGYVETGSSIYSEVNASQDVIVNDHKGFIAGGVIRAGGKVESHTMGSSMGALTRIEVGMAPEKKEQYTMLQRDIAAKNQKIKKLTPIVETYQNYIDEGRQLDEKNSVYLDKILEELSQAKQMLQNSRELFNTLHQELLNSQHAKVVVRRDVFPGVTIVISDISVTVKEKRSFCQFTKSNNQIHISTL